MDTTNVAELIVEQGKNTITSMQNLKGKANKQNKERADLFEKFCANAHSFRVYTYMDPKIGQLEVVQSFMKKVEMFGELFTGVNIEFETTVDKTRVTEAFQEAMEAYNILLNTLQH
ncbi:hypothetical protein [Ornithinibacillus bavariensis]|uniref:hypothetical protein n=1 Tax=Ornithinibacillus bavariensis TaxID=545502 RepID=UPI000EEBDEB2|nr:hypothetical protein [Ornithinibacillus sp.]